MNKIFTFKSKVWRDPKAMGWYFVDLDNLLSQKIKKMPDKSVNKHGLVKALATVGNTTWKTTLFPTKKGNYVMSIIKKIRQKEKIEDKDSLKIKIEI